MGRIGEDVDWAIEVLSRGGLVAIPTETVYGLAANALNEEAVIRLFKAKKRPLFDPLIVHTSGFERVLNDLKHVPQLAHSLADEYWPGPLSLILEKKEGRFSDLITSGHPTVAIRVPRHPLTLALLQKLDFPLVAPSANPFGYVSPTQAQHVSDQLAGEVDYILDGGNTEVGLESTILDLTTSPPLLRRKGGISIEKLLLKIPELQISDVSSSDPKAPGMLKSHYSTLTPLVFVENVDQRKVEGSKTGGLFFREPKDYIPVQNQRILSPQGSLEEAARHLFSYMRELDGLGLQLIITEKVEDVGLGRAINDKLRRATNSSADIEKE